MKMNCTKREFGTSFAKNAAYFVGGFFLMLGFINVMAWLFGKTVAIWLGWITVVVVWIGVITVGLAPEPSLSKEQAEALKEYFKTVKK